VFADRAVAPEFPRENSLSQAENRQNEQPMKSPAKPSVAKNVLSNWGSFLFGAIISFFLAPFIVRHLGDVGYGVWTLLTSLTGYLGLLDMGVRGAVTRYVARFHAQDKKEELQGIVSSGLVVFVTAGLVAIFISVLLAFFGIQHFQVPAEYRATARIVLIIAGVNVAVSLIAGVFGGVVVGLQRFDLTNTVEVTITAARSLLIVFALRAGMGLFTLAALQLLFAIVTVITNVVLVRRLAPQLKIRFNQVDRERLRLIFSFSAYSLLLQLAGYLVYYSDSLVIGWYLPVTSVTFFAIAGNLMTYARAPISSISVTLTPHASSIEATDNLEKLKHVSTLAARYSAAVMLPIAVTFLFRGKAFIGLWMGAEYADLSSKVLIALTVGWMVSAGNQALGGIMMGISKHKALVPVALVEGSINLILSIVLVKKMGIVGVAWATTLPSVCVHGIFWPLYVRRVLKIPAFSYIYSTWIRNACAAIPFVLATMGIEKYWPANNLRVYFLQIFLILPLALLGDWIFVVDKEDRQKVLSRLQSLLRTN
jgi:O-antigen/teichoic acid export membrane protein